MRAPFSRVARITKTHGVHGDVHVVGGRAIETFAEAEVWVVPPLLDGAIARRLTDVRPSGSGHVVHISGVDSLRDAHDSVGRWILARGSEMDFGEDSDPMVGLRVSDRARGYLGLVSEVIVTGANDVLLIEEGPYGRVLIPVIDQVVIGVTDEGSTLEVDLLDGLIEDDAV